MGKSTISMAIFNCYVKLPEVTCALVVSNSPESGWFQFDAYWKCFLRQWSPMTNLWKNPWSPPSGVQKTVLKSSKIHWSICHDDSLLKKCQPSPSSETILNWDNVPMRFSLWKGSYASIVYMYVYMYIYNMFFPGQKVIGIVYSCTISTAAQDWFGCVWPQTTDPNVTLSHPHRPKMDVAGSAFSFEFRENFFGSC